MKNLAGPLEPIRMDRPALEQKRPPQRSLVEIERALRRKVEDLKVVCRRWVSPEARVSAFEQEGTESWLGRSSHVQLAAKLSEESERRWIDKLNVRRLTRLGIEGLEGLGEQLVAVEHPASTAGRRTLGGRRRAGRGRTEDLARLADGFMA